MLSIFKSSKFQLFALTCLALFFYWPAIYGPFLFDDVPNISLLGQNGGIVDFQTWVNFVFGGGSSSIGRPLALASFTLNAQNWPTDPLPFKVTNILIHCFNFYLVYLLLVKILSICDKNKRVDAFLPMLGAALWLFHPIHITTILQVVQRMTLLSGTFVLISLIVYTNYVKNRELSFNKPFSVLVVSLIALGSLGILSKETALVIPLLIFSLNYTVFRNHLISSGKFIFNWQCALLLGPILFFLGVTLYLDSQLEHLWDSRSFSLIERLMTESRILFQYLESLFIPKSNGSGLFHDDIVVSKGIFNPITTVLSIIAVFVLTAIAIVLKKSMPFLSLAIMWFFLGHVFESTIWPLELYFEHRNYIPSLSLIFILLQLSISLAKFDSTKAIRLVLTLYFALTAFVTAITTPAWGDKTILFTTWAHENKSSIRAQYQAATIWLHERQDPNKAREFLNQALQTDPMSTGVRARIIESNCYYTNTIDDLDLLATPLTESKFDWFYLNSISSIVQLKQNSLCPNLSLEFIEQMITRLEGNPNLNSQDGHEWLFNHKSKILLLNKKYSEALTYAEKASIVTPFLGTSILKTEIALKMQDAALAARFLDEALELEKTQSHLISPSLLKQLMHHKQTVKPR